jgi:hypothetical protein
MTLPTKTKESPLFDTRDQNLITILITLKHEVKKFQKRGGIVTVFFDKEATKKDVDAFYGNIAMPLEDARMFIVASAIFRSMIKEGNE